MLLVTGWGWVGIAGGAAALVVTVVTSIYALGVYVFGPRLRDAMEETIRKPVDQLTKVLNDHIAKTDARDRATSAQFARQDKEMARHDERHKALEKRVDQLDLEFRIPQ